MDSRRSRKPGFSSVLQQARQRFSPHTNNGVGAGRAANIVTPEKARSKQHSNHGSQRSFQSTDTSTRTIQHEFEFRDMEMQSLRQEVEQLREALRLTTMELSAMHDKEKELQEERVLRLELKGECQNLKRNLDQCQAEGEEMLNDLLDSAVWVDDLKQKLALKEEAFNQLEESYNTVNQERDRSVDETCTSHVENNDDVFDRKEKMEELQQHARHGTEKQAEGVPREQEELEHLINQRRASHRASDDAAVGSESTSCTEPGLLVERLISGGGQASPCDSALLIRRHRVTSGVLDKFLKDATSLLTVFGDKDNIDIDDGEQKAPTLVNHVGAQSLAKPMLPAAPQDTPKRRVLFSQTRGSLSCSDVIDAPKQLSRNAGLSQDDSEIGRHRRNTHPGSINGCAVA
jgi:myosin heavy subunit